MAPSARNLIHESQDGLLRLFGSDPARRAERVAGMLRRDASEATSYWLQLFVAVGLATLGLVLGSTAVVIGAMLVAPLMAPIVSLAMGLAAGSPVLVMRAGGRILVSVALVIGGAALITLLLPYYEITAELRARAAPTVLDLVTAAFCALAAVYATLRAGADTATTAAGTSIGISLVPPLCASGYGIGTASWEIAGGAGLLFVTNFVAIVAVGTVGFLAVGFHRVDVVRLEREELGVGQDARLARAIARRLSHVFESRFGPVLRVLMPFALLAAVYLPLRRALDEVVWEVQARAAVLDALAAEPRPIVQSRVAVERHTIDVAVVLLGQESDAVSAHARLDRRLLGEAGVEPHVTVLAVPDSSAIAGLASALRPSPVIEAPLVPAVALPTPEEELAASQARVRDAVGLAWPAQAAGAPLSVDVGTTAEGPLEIRVTHLGEALGSVGSEAVARALRESLAREVTLVDVPIPTEPLTRSGGDLALVGALAAALHDARAVPEISLCVSRPEPAIAARHPVAEDVALEAQLDALLATAPRVDYVGVAPWRFLFVTGDCPAAAPPAL
ncbi:MAG: DUF389 domain-containing protein [Sandaracinus sp.]